MMNDADGTNRTPAQCWRLGAIAGAAVALLLWILTSWGFFSSLFAGILVAVIVAIILMWMRSDASDDQVATRSAPASVSSPGAGSTAQDPEQIADAPEAEPVTTEVEAEEHEPAEEDTAQKEVVTPSMIKASKPLAGQAELAARKGEWRYGKPVEAAPAPAAEEPAQKKATPKNSRADTAVAADPGTKPAALEAAREGGPDNLTLIKGVGPKLNRLLHSMGFYHFDQIAAWGPQEVAWVDQNLEGFKGRVSRDGWVDQAKILADGGETEFSARNKKS